MGRDSESDLPRRIDVGDVLAGKYRIEDVLGEGGMGEVFRASHIGLDQKVAVKALLPYAARNEEHVARFEQEAKTLAMLRSDHVARVFDVGKHDNGLPYMVLELLDGSDLSAFVEKRGPLPVDEACDLALQLCAGLADVHAAGIIHRDLKPSNVFVVPQADGANVVKLLDFGISKFHGAATMTRTTTVMGSPGYMSPEQMRSTKDVDERADIWALGAILYELLTARPAFVAENAPSLCLKIASDDPDPPRSLRSEIPQGLERVLLTCLEKSADERYGSVAEVAEALAPFASPRMRAYVQKVQETLEKAAVPPRSATARKGPSPNSRPTLPGGGSGEGRVPTQPGPLAGDPPVNAYAPTEHGSTPPIAPPRRQSGEIAPPRRQSGEIAPPRRQSGGIARPRRRKRGRTGIFVMGSILGAGVAIAYFGDVQKIRAQIESYVTTQTRSAPPPPTRRLVDAAAPAASSAAAPILVQADAAPSASSGMGAPDALDAGADYDDDGGDEDDDEDEFDDAGRVILSDAGGAPRAAKPAAAAGAPKPHPHPTAPRHHPRRHPRRR